MRVQNILRRKDKGLITISVDTSVHEASKSISRERVGMLLVVDGQDKLVGVLSERDIVCFIAKRGVSALDSRVSAAMSTHWLTATPQDSISHLMRVMTEKRARHMPVISDGALVGVISIGDILNSRLAEKDQETEVLRDIARSSLITAT